METLGLVIYGVVAGLAIVQSLLVLLQTWEHRRFARSRLSQLYRYWAGGRAMIYAPCKGVDIDQEDNLRRVLDQDYGDYEVTFVVESVSDPAYGLIRRLAAEHPGVRTHVVIAGLAEDCGQKVHNLRVATAAIPPDIHYVAFIDSDARVRRQWLRGLISHLNAPRVGVATGYRWFVPTGPRFGQYVVYSINCNVAVLFRSRSPNLVWGGSWAMRRGVFDQLRVRAAWEGMLTEDLVVADLVRKHGLRVEFEPACMAPSPIEGGFQKLFGFLRRQYLLGRYYVPGWWRLGFVTTLLANLTLAASAGMLAGGLFAGGRLAWLPAGVLATLYALHVARGLVRQSLIDVYCPEQKKALGRARRFDLWAGPLVSAVSLVGMIASVVGSRATWRGITYELSPGGRTRILARDCAGADLLPLDQARHDPSSPSDAEAPCELRHYRRAG